MTFFTNVNLGYNVAKSNTLFWFKPICTTRKNTFISYIFRSNENSANTVGRLVRARFVIGKSFSAGRNMKILEWLRMGFVFLVSIRCQMCHGINGIDVLEI